MDVNDGNILKLRFARKTYIINVLLMASKKLTAFGQNTLLPTVIEAFGEPRSTTLTTLLASAPVSVSDQRKYGLYPSATPATDH
jgi:hypothetical protein